MTFYLRDKFKVALWGFFTVSPNFEIYVAVNKGLEKFPTQLRCKSEKSVLALKIGPFR